MSKQHFVREGDCISSIAFNYGFHPETLWNHPQNAELRTVRKEGTVLKKGDVVFVPDRTIKRLTKATEAKHVFRRKAVPEMLQIRFLDEEDQPRSGCSYTLNIDGDLRDGKTDREGFLKVSIPPNAVRAHLILYTNYKNGEKEEYDFKLGALQPITELIGIQSRLSHLGYSCENESGTVGELTFAAIRSFQIDHRLPATGEIDEQTRNKIQEVYGA